MARQIGTSKCLALLAYLSLETGPHPREELAALLWGDSSDDAARASLRQALKRLRTAVGDLLKVDRTAVELVGPIDCDVRAFVEAAQRNLPNAGGFGVPRFLLGFAVRHAPAFDEWVERTRGVLLNQFQEILRTSAREAMADSRWRDALDWCNRWTACDPLSDEATRIAIEALYLGGDRAAALARFNDYREQVETQLRSSPSPALLALAQRIEAETQAAPVTPAETGWDTPQPSFDASLVGRKEEWRSLMECWNAVSAGTGRVQIIEGEAGVGKTRLAEEFLRWAALEGATVLRGRGYGPKTGVPYGPIVDALRGALNAPGLAGTAPEWLAATTYLVPDMRQRFPGLPESRGPSDVQDRWHLFEGVVQVLLAVAAERPVAILIDDLQWGDPESCALLHLLVRRIASSPVVLLTTVSTGELERETAPARLYQAIRTEPHASTVRLSPLSEEDVWRIIRELGNIRSPSGGRRFAARIHEVTDGNPFYVIELLKTLFTQGVLAIDPTTGEWVTTSSLGDRNYGRVPMPPTVKDAIGQRVARHPYELRDILATIAMAGRGVSTDLLSHVHGISRLRAAALADALVDRRLVVQTNGGYTCAHPVIADVVRSGLTLARSRVLHRAIAQSLEALVPSSARASLAGEIARHAERGGENETAYRYAMEASKIAERRFALEEALSWLEVAAGVAGDDEQVQAVNRRTSRLFKLAGWTETPPGARRPDTPTYGIARSDLDL